MRTTAPSIPTIDTPPAPAASGQMATAGSRTLGIVSLVLGVAAILSGFTLVLGVAAITVGIIALRTEPNSKGFATAGIVTGGISFLGIAIGFLGILAALPFIGLFGLDWVF